MLTIISGLYHVFLTIIGDISITRFFGHIFWSKLQKLSCSGLNQGNGRLLRSGPRLLLYNKCKNYIYCLLLFMNIFNHLYNN